MTKPGLLEHEVVIAGGGPTGMMLAGELALAGIDVAVVEPRTTPSIDGSRAGGLHARTLEMLDQRGIVERFLAEGQVAQVAGYCGVRLDISDFPSRHPYGLALWQTHIERLLAGWVNELPVTFHRGCSVSALTQDDEGVQIRLSDGRAVRARYLVGCDGGRSLVRKSISVAFPGWDPTISNLIAEVEMTEEPPLGIHRTASGVHGFGKVDYRIVDGEVVYATGGTVRVMVSEDVADRGQAPTLDELRAKVVALRGTDYGMHSARWISRFTDATRQAAAYRVRRVLLAGDAAHIHSPIGGQGLNLGVQDAMNLGWKLAHVIRHGAPDALLDSYHDERHPVAARVLRHTMAQTAWQRQESETDERTLALRETVTDLLSQEDSRVRFGAMMSGLDIRYGNDPDHPLIGRRMPDLDVMTADGAQRVYSWLHDARPVLVNFGARGRPAARMDTAAHRAQALRHERLRVVDALYDGPWTLPAVGTVPPPDAVLVRPDGYVAWVGDERAVGLESVLDQWFGVVMQP